MASAAEETGETKYYGMEFGRVTNVEDPLGIGRVQLVVPGILDQPGPWAPMIGTAGGGAPQVGMFAVPPVGADVAVWFHRGDPQRPYYQGGHYGKTDAGGEEVPTDVKAAKLEDRHKIFSIERGPWIFTLDETATPKAQLRHKKLDMLIDVDGKRGVIEIIGEAALILKSNGMVEIDAPNVRICKRDVLRNGKPVT